ncbi:MAG: monomeric isocitrate dehydrogenase [Microbacterium sp.]|nr:monomeric isocitrate dehydrogenase [Microbacterium sp.]
MPDYPDEPSSLDESNVRARYDRIKGSAVNPVLREGNSDRRAPQSVKNYARNHPHRNKPFPEGSKTRVATMGHDDFRSNETSWVSTDDDVLTIQHVAEGGEVTVLKSDVKVLPGEIVDATFLSAKALDAFLADTLETAASDDLLYSVHLKATMMKVSDPIIFGHVVTAYFADVFAEHGDALAAAGLTPDNGLGSILAGLGDVEGGDQIAAAIAAGLASGPRLSYTNSDKGITNLHVPSDVIVDASMPALVRNGGKLWGADGGEDDTLAVIPDSSYASVYQAVIDDVIAQGPLDPATIGSVSNVGLMAQAAEEYGSHDKTFEIAAPGTVQVLTSSGEVVLEHRVQPGDIWRATQTKDIAIRDWVKLAVTRARATGVPAVFWLDETRAHDAQLIAKVNRYLADHDTDGLQIEILAPAEATIFSLERMRQGEDTVSVTGNVLRDYLTDLFPILEVGTSAKMLSIVPLLAGGGLFETGAGQPRQPLLPGAVLGARAGGADGGCGTRRRLRARRRAAHRERGGHRRRARGRAGLARRDRRLLPPRHRAGDEGHAAVRHAERDRRRDRLIDPGTKKGGCVQHPPFFVLAATQWWTETSVPLGAQSNTYFACETGMFTQPWLIGVPKLLCQ